MGERMIDWIYLKMNLNFFFFLTASTLIKPRKSAQILLRKKWSLAVQTFLRAALEAEMEKHLADKPPQLFQSTGQRHKFANSQT